MPGFFREVDVHTHVDEGGDGAIVCVTPDDGFGASSRYSAGIHPWEADRADEVMFGRLEAMCADPRVVAVGECGLDARRGPDMASVQLPVFERQARLAESLGLPLIIHAVACWPMLIAAKKRLKPTVPWIIHGFRGKLPLAQQLVDQGFYLSLGARHNPEVAAVIDPIRLLRETDAEKPS